MSGPLPVVVSFGDPSSAAAHRLAWWLNETGERWARLTQSLGVRSGWLERALRGEVVPSWEMRDAIAGLTQGRVPAAEWDLGCCLGWCDRPAGWVTPPARAVMAAGAG